MRVVGIVQARMGSSRLPGKVLMELEGSPVAAHTVRRLGLARSVDQVVLATSEAEGDDPLEALAAAEDVPCVRGSEHDVLARFVLAARETEADAVVRVTADCPLVDPEIVDRTVAELVDHATECDYASNVIRRTYPRGLDVEALFADTLERMGRLARSPAAREHVTVHAYRERPELYMLRSVELEGEDFSDLDWSIDDADDLERIRRIYRDAGSRPAVTWRALLGAA